MEGEGLLHFISVFAYSNQSKMVLGTRLGLLPLKRALKVGNRAKVHRQSCKMGGQSRNEATVSYLIPILNVKMVWE